MSVALRYIPSPADRRSWCPSRDLFLMKLMLWLIVVERQVFNICDLLRDLGRVYFTVSRRGIEWQRKVGISCYEGTATCLLNHTGLGAVKAYNRLPVLKYTWLNNVNIFDWIPVPKCRHSPSALDHYGFTYSFWHDVTGSDTSYMLFPDGSYTSGPVTDLEIVDKRINMSSNRGEVVLRWRDPHDIQSNTEVIRYNVHLTNAAALNPNELVSYSFAIC